MQKAVSYLTNNPLIIHQSCYKDDKQNRIGSFQFKLRRKGYFCFQLNRFSCLLLVCHGSKNTVVKGQCLHCKCSMSGNVFTVYYTFLYDFIFIKFQTYTVKNINCMNNWFKLTIFLSSQLVTMVMDIAMWMYLARLTYCCCTNSI